jgi:hypothetical protein
MDAMAGIPRTATAFWVLRAGSIPLPALPRYPHASVQGISRFLEHPWKMMEGLVATSARRGIPGRRW